MPSGTPPRLNLADPLTNGLAGYQLSLLGGIVIELVQGGYCSCAPNESAASPYGLALNITSSTNTVGGTNTHASFGAGVGAGWTMSVLTNVFSQSANNGSSGLEITSGDNITMIFNGNYTGTGTNAQWGAGWYDGGNSIGVMAGNSLPSVATWHLYSWTHLTTGSGSTDAFYFDNAPVSATSDNSATINFAFQTNQMYLGGSHYGNYTEPADYAMGAFWTRSLSQAEIIDLFGQVQKWGNGGAPPMTVYPQSALTITPTWKRPGFLTGPRIGVGGIVAAKVLRGVARNGACSRRQLFRADW